MVAKNSLVRLTIVGLAVGLLSLTSRLAHPQAQPTPPELQPRGLQQVAESEVVPFASRLLGRADGELGGIDVAATLVSGSESEDPEGRIAVSLEALVRVEAGWSAGHPLRVTLLAYDLEEVPLLLEEAVALPDPSAAAWWVYRRVVLLPEDFMEAVVVVEDLTGSRRGGSRVAYGPSLAVQVEPVRQRTGILVDQMGLAAPNVTPTATAAVLRLVPPPGRSHVGQVRLRTVVTTDAVSRVSFLLDGESAGSDDNEPFTFQVDLGQTPAAHEITAIAYSSTERELGRDRLVLNAVLELFDVRLELADDASGSDGLRLRALVTVPREASLDRVEFYRNEILLRTQLEGPFEAEVARRDLGADDYLRAVAYLADGASLDDVRLLSDVNAGERINVNLVEIFAVATDRKGEPVADLKLADFEVRLGRRKIEVERFERAVDVPLTLGLVFDTSGSMVALMPDAKQAGARFLGSIVRDRDRAFLIDFDTRPRLAHGLTRDLGSLLRRFGRLEAKGRTALYDAVVFGALQFDAEGGRRALVVLTDGVPSGGRFGARDCIKLAVEKAIPIYSIDLSGVLSASSSAKLPLLALAKSTGGQVHTIPGDPTGLGDYEGVSRALEEAYAQIERELRSQYILAFSTAAPLTAQEIKSLRVEVARPGTKVRRVVGAS